MARRRTRSPHPGVVLIPPTGEHVTWRARFTDPDVGRMVKERIDPVAVRTAEARREWAIRKAKALAKRRGELDGGAPRATGTGLSAAVDRYFEDHTNLRTRTLFLYRRSARKFLEWATRKEIHTADDVGRENLVAFRASRVTEGRNATAAGGARGEKRSDGEKRSPATINVELGSLRTVLGYLRKLALLPRITSDDLKDGLERLRVNHERIDYRKPAELQKLLEAALRHDAATFAATREEHAGLRPLGSTERYEPIAPFVACALLTGMRFGEVVDLDWKQVDLEALDHEGRAVGEIYLSAATKTHKARTVGLEVSPALRKMLAALKLKGGGKGSVFGLTRDGIIKAERRLRNDYGAPPGCNWQALRRTCGTYLTNAPGIFGSAAAFHSAKQLGHSVKVAEDHYLGLVRGIPRDARRLEDAMQINKPMARIIAAVGARPAAVVRKLAG
jgi:integrase